MIQFVNPILTSRFNIDTFKINVLIIENPNFMASIVNDILSFLEKNETETRFVENGDLYKKIDKIYFITDLFNLDFNSKALQNCLVKKMVGLLNGYEFQINEIYEKSYQMLNKCLLDLNVSFDINPSLEKQNFVKMFSPTIQSYYSNLLEKLIEYANVLVELLDLKCLIVLNLHEYLSFEECKQFYKHCMGKDIAVLTLQSRKKYEFEDEQILIIDEDLCEVVANYEGL